MKRKRDTWDFGESTDLYNTKTEDLERSIRHHPLPPCIHLTAAATGSTTNKIPVPDLLQRKTTTYALHRDKRVVQNQEGAVITRVIQLFLPDFLRESLWRRHEYSLSDITLALKACPKEYIWQLALYYNVQILNSASRPSSCFIIRGGKSSAIERMEHEFQKSSSPFHAWRTRPSVLLKTKSCHKDPMYLPFHFISRIAMDMLVHMLPEEKRDAKDKAWLGQAVRHYQRHAKWTTAAAADETEDVHLVPLAVYWRVLPSYDFILLNRVLPYAAYCQRYEQNTPSTPLSEWTDIVYIGDERFALLDEAFYAVCARP